MISLINTRSHWTDVIEQNHFPDGTLHINMPPNYFDYDTVLWEYENDAELFTLICVKGHFKDCPLRLDMPYIPHARMVELQTLVIEVKIMLVIQPNLVIPREIFQFCTITQ